MIFPAQRQSIRKLEADRLWAQRAMKRGRVTHVGSWFLSFLPALVIPAFPVGFTWLCIDFLPEVNAMNIFLCTVSTLIVLGALYQIGSYLIQGHNLLTIRSKFDQEISYQLTIKAFQKLGYQIEKANKHLVIANIPVGEATFYSRRRRTITAIFEDSKVHIHAQELWRGDEEILFRNTRAIRNRAAQLLQIVLK